MGQSQRNDYASGTESLMRRAGGTAHAAHVTSGPTTRNDGLAVEIPCRECGLPIVMVAGPEGTEIADRTEFLRVHRACLVASVPPQRSGS